jgi:hypothetical protein
MIRKTDYKALEALKDGVVGLEGFFSRVEIRKPWAYRKGRRAASAGGAWLWKGLAFLSVLAGWVLVSYRQKRRQVAEHYNMGDSRGQWQATPDPGAERLGNHDRYGQYTRSH